VTLERQALGIAAAQQHQGPGGWKGRQAGQVLFQALLEFLDRRPVRLVFGTVRARVSQIERQGNAPRFRDNDRRKRQLQEAAHATFWQGFNLLQEGQQLKLCLWREPVVYELLGWGIEAPGKLCLQLIAGLRGGQLRLAEHQQARLGSL